MATNSQQHILIIGNGIAGVTAAQTVRRLSDHRITIVSDENLYFYARTALMYLYLGQQKYEHIKPLDDWYWPENRIVLVQDRVNAIDFALKSLSLASGKQLPYDKLLLATGSQTSFYDWPGQHLDGVHGFYGLHDLARIEQATRNGGPAIIVGGGLIGVELAEMLHSRNLPVTMLVRDKHYWGKNLPEEEAIMIGNRLSAKGIHLKFGTTLKKLEGDADGKVCAAITDKGERLVCTFAGIATGVAPNIALAAETGLDCRRGILVNEYLETSQPEVFAAGDCTELTFVENRVEQLWYTGRMQGETAGYNLSGHKIAYNRGIPFNSAKFFDLEFQSYGNVVPQENENTIFWQNENGTASIRLNYRNDSDKAITGFVLLNVRYRQEVCEKWIREKRPVTDVLAHLEEANFDPEFQRRHEKSILHVFRKANPDFSPASANRNWLSRLFS